ncbi:MAG: hypothetical protein BWY76_01484 [bacterium ADurb.Bin429]|nr:MAG: hypothetical protein BWY76_01484 [bacterium ADurb.Bin429]
MEIFQHSIHREEDLRPLDDGVEAQIIYHPVGTALKPHAAPDADIRQGIRPIPAVAELRLAQPAALVIVAMAINAFGLLVPFGKRLVGGEFGAGGQSHHHLVLTAMQQASYVENRGHEGVDRGTNHRAVEEDLRVEIKPIKDELLSFLAQEGVGNRHRGTIPPRMLFRPAALLRVGAHQWFVHLSGAHQVEMDFARHAGMYPAVRLARDMGIPGLAVQRKAIRTHQPVTVYR